jgi:hypothetical protein
VDHRQLMQWVWNYFTDELSTGAEPPHEARDHAWRKHIEDDPVILSGAHAPRRARGRALGSAAPMDSSAQARVAKARGDSSMA